jgi:hypothetical protein
VSTQVPEDLLSILNDPHLFANGPEVTTKDILKRYGDIANRPPPKQHMIVANSPPQTKEGNRPPSTPVFHRVDSDLAQSSAWQKETSARPSGVAAPTTTQPTQPTHPAQPNPAHLGQPTHGHRRAGSGSSQLAEGVPNGQNDQNIHLGQDGQEEYRNWGQRQPSQTHQPIGA